jgi:ubiquinone/menaquinone biosynthesis C-methylase UbiE
MKKTPRQKDIFFQTEADGWYARNRVTEENFEEKCQDDPLLKILSGMDLKKSKILEIGASNGWRLAALRKKFSGAQCFGVDPSVQAVNESWPDIELRVGSADSLPYDDNSFDLVVFGFCLYLCDRRDLFKIAAAADRVLKDGGYVVTYDFHTPQAYKNPYVHQSGMFSYKMDYSCLFSWNPVYSLVQEHVQPHPGSSDESPDGRVGVMVLKKDFAKGWPDNPYKK